jgi:hypothetical protein
MSTSQIIMLAAAVVGLTILMLSTRRKLRDHQQRTHPTARERFTELEREVKTTRNVEEVMLELDQLSRQIHGRLDTKFAKLEAIIRDADQRIAELSRLLRASSGGAAFDVTVEATGADEPPPDSSSECADHPRAAVYRLAESGLSPSQIAEKVGKPLGEVELILALQRAKQQAAESLEPVHGARSGPKG